MSSESQSGDERIKLYLEKLNARKKIANNILENSKCQYPPRIRNISSGILTPEIENDPVYLKLLELSKDTFVSSEYYDSFDVRMGASDLIKCIMNRSMRENQYNSILQADQGFLESICYFWYMEDD